MSESSLTVTLGRLVGATRIVRSPRKPRRKLVAVVLASSLVAVTFAGPAIARSGGPYDGSDSEHPNSGGYYFTDSDEVDGPAYDWRDISATGIDTGVGCDDCLDNTMTLPFKTTFYGITSDQITISSNGVLFFGPETTSVFRNTALPASMPQAMMPWWDDLDLRSGNSRILYQTLGQAPNREFVVQYDRVDAYSNDPEITFQVVFFEETDDVLFQYLDAHLENDTLARSQGGEATVGINRDADIALQYSNDERVLHDELAILFTRGLSVDLQIPGRLTRGLTREFDLLARNSSPTSYEHTAVELELTGPVDYEAADLSLEQHDGTDWVPVALTDADADGTLTGAVLADRALNARSNYSAPMRLTTPADAPSGQVDVLTRLVETDAEGVPFGDLTSDADRAEVVDNALPTASDVYAQTEEDQAVIFTLAGEDLDGEDLSYAFGDVNGTVVDNGNGGSSHLSGVS